VRSCVVLVAFAGACSSGREEPARKVEAEPPVPGSAQACEQLPFEQLTPLPEASGAGWLTIDGQEVLVVVADSGHDGAFAIIDPETGATRVQGKLPLGDGAGDDLEGVATRGDRMYGLTSNGYMRVWQWSAAGGAFQLVDGPYPIGSGDDICPPHKSNCARDYEGLAIAPQTDPRVQQQACVGFACARADGALYCLVEQSGKLHIDRARRIPVVDARMALADCAFSESGALYTGSNLFGLAKVHRVDGWSDPSTATVVELEALGTGFPEVIAVREDIIYRMSDMGGTGPSLMTKFRCKAPTR
jgi:hypothetical protein